MVAGVVTIKSACAPSLTFTGSRAPDWKLSTTLYPLARSNMGTSSSSTSRMAVDAMTLISAAWTALAASTVPRQAATAVAFDHMLSSLGLLLGDRLGFALGRLQPPAR